MINGIQKYLMIALSAVFLWGFSVAASVQELEKTILPMKEVRLVYKPDSYLLAKSQAKQLDTVIMHMRNKPTMIIHLESLEGEFNKKQPVGGLRNQRIKMVLAYLSDQGINRNRIEVPEVYLSLSHGDSYITITEPPK